MYYKRQEAFRYTFVQSIPAICEVFQSTGSQEKQKVQSFGASILNISPNGLKAASKSNIEIKDDQVLVFSFQLAATLISFPGKIVRKRLAGADEFHYSIQSDGNETLKNQIIASLKIHTKEQLKKSKC